MPINHIKNITIADGANTDIVRPGDWNSAHAYTLQDAVAIIGNTTGATTSINSGTLYLAGGNNITLSQNANSVTISQFLGFEVFYENDYGALQSQSHNNASISIACGFVLPYPLTMSFLRIPISFGNNSTTVASFNGAGNMSAAVYSTWNAVIYSRGNGASSKSLLSYVSGGASYTWMQSLSFNTSSFSVTQGWSGNVEGGATTITTSYATNSSVYNLSTSFFTQMSGLRFLDLNFTGSMDAGRYWLILGGSTSSATNNPSMIGATSARLFYSQHWGISQMNSNFGVIGGTNLTSGGLLGAGSFSTVGGGTTSILPVSAISSTASNVRPYFQIIRSA